MTLTSPAASNTNTYEVLRRRVQDRIASADLDEERDPDKIRHLIATVVDAYEHEAARGLGGRPLSDRDQMVERLGRSILGFGALEPFIHSDDPPIEVKARGGFLTWKDQYGKWHTSTEPTTEDELLHGTIRLLEPTGRPLNEAQPIVSTQVLGRRARLTASVPPVSDDFELSLRFYRRRTEELGDLVGLDTLTHAAANFMWAVMRHKQTGVVVSGPPQAGKTTFANALLRAVPNSHVVSCNEDTRELNAPLMHISYRQTKPRTGLSDEDSEITLRQLVHLSLRDSPTRIVVGEIRGSEAVELTRAGDAGAAMLVTLHAHSATDALDALSNAALLGDHNLSPEIVRATFARTVDVVCHLDAEDVELRGDDERRRVRRQVMEIAAVSPFQAGEQRFTTVPIFQREDIGAPLMPTGHPLPEKLQQKLDRAMRRYGTTIQAVIEGGEIIRQ